MSHAVSTTTLSLNHHHHHHHHHHRRPSSKFITFPKISPSLTPITASSRNPNYQNPMQHQIPKPSLSFLKTTFITGVTVAAIFLPRLTVKPAVAAPTPSSPPPAATETRSEEKSLEDYWSEQITLEEYLCSYPEDIEALKALMEIKLVRRNVLETIGILNQLIYLEPENIEWQFLKPYRLSYAGDHESAKLGFENFITYNPLCVKAYHGLVMTLSATESVSELNDLEKRVVKRIETCERRGIWKQKDIIGDFKLLLAQIRVIQGDYNGGIKIYKELMKSDPLDFRPHLCEGIVYTLLGKNDDAENSFGQYRKLVPNGHPYVEYFDKNMVATKGFARVLENERA